jgi:hypothetical protein
MPWHQNAVVLVNRKEIHPTGGLEVLAALAKSRALENQRPIRQGREADGRGPARFPLSGKGYFVG